jgi:hypothetical protein
VVHDVRRWLSNDEKPLQLKGCCSMSSRRGYTPTTEDYYRDDRQSDNWEAVVVWAFRGLVLLSVFALGLMAGWLLF